MELTPDERARIEAIREEIGPTHPYAVDGYRSRIGTKADVKAERNRMEQTRSAWAKLDLVTRDYVRWTTAGRIIEVLARSSNRSVADAIAASSEDELDRLRGELAEGYRFADTGDGFEVAEECEVAPGEGSGPLDLPAMLDEAESALRLPTGRAEELPNLRNVALELYAIWRRDQLPGAAKVSGAAVEAVAGEIGPLYGLLPKEAERRTKVALLELDALDQLPLR